MSKYDIRPQFECQNRILNVKIQYLDIFYFRSRILIVKTRYLVLNVKILYFASIPMSKYDILSNFGCKKTKNEK